MAEGLTPHEEQTGSYARPSEAEAAAMRRLSTPKSETDYRPPDSDMSGPGYQEFLRAKEALAERTKPKSNYERSLEDMRQRREIDAAMQRINEVYDRD